MPPARVRRVVTVAALATVVGLPAAPAAAATGSHRPTTVSATAAHAARNAPTAPTNLRVRTLTPTSVAFEWDASAGAQPGCTLQIILYAVYLNRRFVGWTYLGSPVAVVGGLRPGRRYELAVQGRDNCTGAVSPLSRPLVVRTPVR